MRRKHFVYVLATVRNGLHAAPSKIGVSSNVMARLHNIQTSCAHKLDIAFSFEVEDLEQARLIERETHQLFERWRLNGEWFDLHPWIPVNGVASCVEHVRVPPDVSLFCAERQILLDRFGVTAALHYCEGQVPGSIMKDIIAGERDAELIQRERMGAS